MPENKSQTRLMLDLLCQPGMKRTAEEEGLTEDLLLDTGGNYDLERIREAYRKRLYRQEP